MSDTGACCDALQKIVIRGRDLKAVIESADDIGLETAVYLAKQVAEIIDTCLYYIPAEDNKASTLL